MAAELLTILPSYEKLSCSRTPRGSPPVEKSNGAKPIAAGLGAALLPKFLIQRELDRGELAVILDIPTHSDFGYYLVTPSDKSHYPPNAAFRIWIQKMASLQN